MTPATVYLLRDPNRPGRYQLATPAIAGSPESADGAPVELDVIPWNEARRRMVPDAFSEMARLSFADWCARNGW